MNSYFKEITKSYEILKPEIKKNGIYGHFCKTLIEQYKNIKINNFAFFMQVGSFYESYAWKLKINDIDIDFNYKLFDRLSSILHMVKSRKNSSNPHSINNPYMFGFPDKSKDRHIDRLLNENIIIVLVHQRDSDDDPKIKIRDTIEIFNPCTNINNTSNDNFTMSIALNLYKNDYYSCGISLFNLNSNENYVYECIDSKNYKNNVKNKIYKINITYNPTEIIFYNFTKIDNHIIIKKLDLELFDKNIIFFDDIINKDLLKLEYQREYFKEIYDDDILLNNNLKHYNLNFYEEARLSFILLLDYIGKINKLFLNNISKPKFIEIDDSLNIDYNTLDQLNIVSAEKKYEKFCLIEILDYTSTVMGKRFLTRRITNPLTNIEELNLNYDISAEMNNYVEFEKILNNIYDLSRYHKKIYYQRISPQDLYILFDNYEHICKLLDLSSQNTILNNFIQKKIKKKKIEKIIKEFKKRFNLPKIKNINSCDITTLNEIIFKKNFNKKLNKFINQYNILKSFKKDKLNEIKTFFNSYIKGKYKFKGEFETNNNYINITKTKNNLFNKYKNSHENMKDYFITQTGKSKYFLRSPILDEKYDQELLVWDNINNKQNILFKKYLLSLQKYKDVFHHIEYIIGFVDFIKSNVKVSKINKYSRPIIDNDNSFFDIKDFRHPIIEKINKDTEFVKNDLYLDSEKLGLVLTGDNGIGKSSLLKSIGICVIMAQSGMFVPCKSMSFYPFSNILTRIKGNDNIFSNSSSFQIEMIELCNILQKSNEKSLVLVDELCKGTEQASSHSLTLSVIDDLVNNKKCKFIITTHMHSIFKDDLFKQLIKTNKIFTKYMEVEITKGEIIYKRKLADGSSGEIYGLEIARMLGIDSNIISKAMTIRNKFLNVSNEIVSTKKSRYNPKKYMTKCEICGKKEQDELETHHIVEQKESNDDGFLEKEMYHKNELFNLMILCKKCHKKITFKKMKTSKKKLTSQGIKVEQI